MGRSAKNNGHGFLHEIITLSAALKKDLRPYGEYEDSQCSYCVYILSWKFNVCLLSSTQSRRMYLVTILMKD